MTQARRMLATGRNADEVIEFLAMTLTNRLMHSPSQRLREAAERGEPEIIQAAQELFALSDTPAAAITQTEEAAPNGAINKVS
jgi:glutamyl-tRNA reductase